MKILLTGGKGQLGLAIKELAPSQIDNNLIPINSIRGKRFFGPSKMSFFNLIKHSLSIISVFRKAFLIRSALFIILYIVYDIDLY